MNQTVFQHNYLFKKFTLMEATCLGSYHKAMDLNLFNK
jgi:hypothetical protein